VHQLLGYISNKPTKKLAMINKRKKEKEGLGCIKRKKRKKKEKKKKKSNQIKNKSIGDRNDQTRVFNLP
jgi:hypothetical protein